VKKVRGKIKPSLSARNLGALITDRKIAERTLREWLEGLVHPSATPRAEMTFGELR
jgi:hypothetical protein